MSDAAKIHTETLEMLRMWIRRALADSSVEDMIRDVQLVEMYGTAIGKQCAYEIESFVWAQEKESREISYPADWWQAFRDRWFPRWAKRRWPVRYAKWQCKVYATYPSLRIAPREGHIAITKMRMVGPMGAAK